MSPIVLAASSESLRLYLKETREQWEGAKRLLVAGIDPSAKKRATAAEKAVSDARCLQLGTAAHDCSSEQMSAHGFRAIAQFVEAVSPSGHHPDRALASIGHDSKRAGPDPYPYC